MRWKRFLTMTTVILAILTVTLTLGTVAVAQAKYKILHTFHGKDGASPVGYLIFDAAGNLYGTTYSGGIYDTNCQTGSCGTVYELNPNVNGTWTQKVIRYFTPEDTGPDGGVTLDAFGNLYGMTNQGPYDGDVYELTPQTGGGWSYEFCIRWEELSTVTRRSA